MYEKTNNYFLVLTVQRYSKKPTRENLFNESALSFSEMNDFTFVYFLMRKGFSRGISSQRASARRLATTLAPYIL